MSREEDIDEFYRIMDELENKVGGKRFLSECDSKMNWPQRGVYFFFEKNELRGNGKMRIVRVGTHALQTGSSSILWERLRQHRGNTTGSHKGGGNHRGSAFRLHVGSALIMKMGYHIPTWGEEDVEESEVRDAEHEVEVLVSDYINSMPFLWLAVGDAPGPDSLRGYIETNSIGLLSNYEKEDVVDPPFSGWLGRYSENEKIRFSGMWNVIYADGSYDPGFLDKLRELIEAMD